MLLVGSPMCTAFSAWQRINNLKRDPNVVSREYVRAMVHIRFTMELYQMQHAAGGATSCTSPPHRRAHGPKMLFDEFRRWRVCALSLVTSANLELLMRLAGLSRSQPSSCPIVTAYRKLSRCDAKAEGEPARDLLEAAMCCAMVKPLD